MFQLRLEAVDLDGNPVQHVKAGTEFEVRMLASDLREGDVAQGLFAAFADIVYRADLLKLASGDQGGPAQFGKDYPNVRRGDFSRPGVVNEFGAVAGMTPVGADELLVGSVRFFAQAAGTARFGIDPCEDVVQHQLLAYGLGQGITNATRHLGTTLQIVRPNGEFVPDDGWMPAVDRNLRGIPQMPDRPTETASGEQADSQVINVEAITSVETIPDPLAPESVDLGMAMTFGIALNDHLTAIAIHATGSTSFDKVQAAARIQPGQLFDANHQLLASRHDRTPRLPALAFDFNRP